MKDYLIINRSKWRTGGNTNDSSCKTGEGYTALLNEKGYMCCLGFRCHQMGVPKKDLLGKGVPDELYDEWDIPDLVNEFGNDTNFTRQAVKINDNVSYTHEEREKKITEHFATIGVTVEFKGKYK